MSLVDDISAAAAQLGVEVGREKTVREQMVDRARRHYDGKRTRRRTRPWMSKSKYGFWLALTMAQLVVALKDGPVPADAVLSGELSEYSRRLCVRTLYRAKRELRIQSFQRRRVWYWRLPHESLYRKAVTLPESEHAHNVAV
jgi:hypothetical protein